MTIDDLLDIAIQFEISSQNLYASMMEKATDDETRVFLKNLVDEEKGHEDLLTTMKDMEIYDGSIPVEDDSLIKGVGESHTVENTPAPESIQKVLELALMRETRAHNMFVTLSKACKNDELKLMFEKLAAEEMNHHHNIEKKYAMQKGEMGFEM
jgi:rubrerythrin